MTRRRRSRLQTDGATCFEFLRENVLRISDLHNLVATTALQHREIPVGSRCVPSASVVDRAVTRGRARANILLPLRHLLVIVVVDAECAQLGQENRVLRPVAAIAVLVHPIVRDVEGTGLDRRIGVVAVVDRLLVRLQNATHRDGREMVRITVDTEAGGGRGRGGSRRSRERDAGDADEDHRRQCDDEGQETLEHGELLAMLRELFPLGV